MNGLGCHPPDPAKLAAHPSAAAHPAIRARLASAEPLPDAADNLPPWFRLNQGQSSACTACSFVIGVMLALLAAGSGLGWVPSQQECYALTRAMIRALLAVAGQPADPLTDNGADLEDVIAIGQTYGLRPMKVATSPDGRVCDVWTKDDGPASPNVNDEPDVASAEQSFAARIEGAHVILPTDPNISDLVAAALAASPAMPVWCTFYCDSAFQRTDGQSVMGAPNLADTAPGTGGHAVAFSKYRTNAAGRREFWLENSWGPKWALGGGVWVSEAFLAASWALYVLSVRKVAEA